MTDDDIAETARLLDEARAPNGPLDAFPEGRAPADETEAFAIHEALVARHGPVVAWKTGAPMPTAEPMYGQIAEDTLHPSPAAIPAAAFRLWAVEAEIAVTLARDLPDRETPYDADEVLAAIGAWHAAIEVLDTAFADWHAASPLWRMADRQSHGALIIGPGRPERPSGPLDRLPVRLLVDGEAAFAHEGGNTGGDPVRLLVGLANRLRATARPLKVGDVVTTGSTTPFHQVGAGQRVVADFDGLDVAELVVGAWAGAWAPRRRFGRSGEKASSMFPPNCPS